MLTPQKFHLKFNFFQATELHVREFGQGLLHFALYAYDNGKVNVILALGNKPLL